MRRVVFAAALTVLPLSANAAWFCGDEPTDFARNRVASALSGHRIDYDDITYGRNFGPMAMVCNEGKEFGTVCRTEPAAPPTSEDYTARVDTYQDMVDSLDSWADKLSDGCLRDAYHAIADGHRKIIEKDRRAIEFMKTPAPWVAIKSGS